MIGLLPRRRIHFMRPRALSLWWLALVAALPAAAHAGPWIPAPGEYYAQFEADRAYADTYLDADGGRRPLNAANERRSIDSYLELGWKKRLSFILAAPIA